MKAMHLQAMLQRFIPLACLLSVMTIPNTQAADTTQTISQNTTQPDKLRFIDEDGDGINDIIQGKPAARKQFAHRASGLFMHDINNMRENTMRGNSKRPQVRGKH
ncbi:hypothetical protein [Prosthecochloris sp. CIB 2401]|uniref:hypothetical protein n=1 Tax=Prosthecochloris sp. CIB 2401 TaxID=1868325 RepID=UPI0012EADF21|nr:hypothetical protein [Prosthecochloris sp. CIB 2401]